MTKNRKCPICASEAQADLQVYNSGKFDKTGTQEIVVEDVEVYKCTNQECLHTWLPLDQERKIDKKIAVESRFDLIPDQIKLVRESLPFNNKFQTADFLCLNEKAFTKWELGYSGPNRAYDLLLRLSVFSRDNFSFIKHLHETNFHFNPNDYQLVCERHNLAWNFNVLISSRQYTTAGLVSSTQHVYSGGALLQNNDNFLVQTPKKAEAESQGAVAA